MEIHERFATRPTKTDAVAVAEWLSSASERWDRDLRVAVHTGGFDRHYAFGLVMGLAARGVAVDVIGSDLIESGELHTTPGVRFLNFYKGKNPNSSRLRKLLWLGGVYLRLCRYALSPSPEVFHILWNTKVPFVDRVLLMLLYRVRSKRVMLTAHNVNTSKRDGGDNWWNRLTLRIQYGLCHRIFVHTKRMGDELVLEYGVPPEAVVSIPYGINNAIRRTTLSCEEARDYLRIHPTEKVILFYGRIQPYKGLDLLADAFAKLCVGPDRGYRLLIAGEPQKESSEHWQSIQQELRNAGVWDRVMAHIQFIPDDETEVYFKAADVLALPYRDIYQSGVLFMSYSFGLPVIASDVGSFREEVAEGENGYLCESNSSESLETAIETYFKSELFRTLNERRDTIQGRAEREHSWSDVARISCIAYKETSRESR